jgi:hypothetical protein
VAADQIVMSAIGLAAVVAGGATVGGLIIVAIRYVLSNDVLKAAIENLYLSQPVDKRNLIRSGVVVAKEAADPAHEITDGVVPERAAG